MIICFETKDYYFYQIKHFIQTFAQEKKYKHLNEIIAEVLDFHNKNDQGVIESITG
jgi:hypothetical protein